MIRIAHVEQILQRAVDTARVLCENPVSLVTSNTEEPKQHALYAQFSRIQSTHTTKKRRHPQLRARFETERITTMRNLGTVYFR